jgi:hypothetical protein
LMRSTIGPAWANGHNARVRANVTATAKGLTGAGA